MIFFESKNPLGPIRTVRVSDFTQFGVFYQRLSPGLNVILGENGAGKTHFLKLCYAVTRSLYPSGPARAETIPAPELLGGTIADKLVACFLPDSLGRLCRRGAGAARLTTVEIDFQDAGDVAFSIRPHDRKAVKLIRTPDIWPDKGWGSPVFVPTREVLTLFPNFIAAYQREHIGFDETYYDLLLALAAPLAREAAEDKRVAPIVRRLEKALDGQLIVDKGTGRFAVKRGRYEFEIPLLAEGQRKLAMLVHMLKSGALVQGATLYWDEPEANLNPRLMVPLARSLVDLAGLGLQIVAASHSLFFVRELAYWQDIVRRKRADAAPEPVFLSFVPGERGIEVERGADLNDLITVAALDEALRQDHRMDAFYLDGDIEDVGT
jgi:energy-coupling factor transporter ATP-binding protein EcfA2